MELKKIIYKKLIFWIIFSIILSIIINLIMVFISKNIEFIMNSFELGEKNDFYLRFSIILILCLSFFLINFLYYFVYYMIDIKAKKISLEYAYNNYLNRDFNYFSSNSVGEITYSITHLSREVGTYFATFWSTIVVNLLTIVILFVTISQYSLPFAIGIVVVIVLFIFFTSFISNKISNKTEEQETYASNMHDYLVESFNGITILKELLLEKRFQKRLIEDFSKKKYRCDMQKNIWYSLYIVLYDVMMIILPILTLVFGFLFHQYSIISIGAILAIYSIVGLLQEPIRNIADSITYFKEHRARIKKLNFIKVPSETYENFKIDDISLKIKEIKSKDTIILRDIHLNIKRNDIVSLKGKTGSGKSSILKMLMKVSPFADYECYYNGINQESIPIKSIFENILLVEQTPFLFSTTLKENICMGEKYADEILNEVISICQLEDMKEKYGLDKVINTNSSNISGGEMQRVCIARVLIRKPRILLVDEITSSLDDITADQLVKKIVEFVKRNSMTLIAVSHKNEFEHFSNQIINLDCEKGGDICEKNYY